MYEIQLTGADIIELKPQKDYSTLTSYTLGLIHIRGGHEPKLLNSADISQYNRIYLGSPVWFYTYVPPINSFIKNNNFKGKEIALFSTHMGNNGKIFENLSAKLDGGILIGKKDFFSVKKSKSSTLSESIDNWIKMLNN